MIFLGSNRPIGNAGEKRKSVEELRRMSSDSGVEAGEQGVSVIDDNSSPTPSEAEVVRNYHQGKIFVLISVK